MSRGMEQWEKNNIFRSHLADEIFRDDILEKIANDYKEVMIHTNKEITRENMEDVIYEMIENIENSVEWFLDEEFEDDAKRILSHIFSEVPSEFIDKYLDEKKWLINNQSKVDAVPVVHAEWIDTQPDHHNGFYRNPHKCSNCNDYYTTEYDDLFFCPRCGAKMDGKKV